MLRSMSLRSEVGKQPISPMSSKSPGMTGGGWISLRRGEARRGGRGGAVLTYEGVCEDPELDADHGCEGGAEEDEDGAATAGERVGAEHEDDWVGGW